MAFQAKPLMVAILVVAIALVAILANTRSAVISDGSVVTIRNVITGRYLMVTGDGIVRLSANATPSDPSTRFRVVTLSSNVVQALIPKDAVQKETVTKDLCPCSGYTDDYGFGRYCHSWESEYHEPWCYVEDYCAKAKKGHRARKHQSCSDKVGFLGPEGYVNRPGCECSGHESVHGFGAYCRGWEFEGQTPWCYVNDNCTDSAGGGGSFGSKFAECLQDVPPPPPSPPPPPPSPPLMSSPPPPPSPPPQPWVESRGGWGTPSDCTCSGYSSKLGFGSYCKAWEYEKQTPWCYVTENCTDDQAPEGFQDEDPFFQEPGMGFADDGSRGGKPKKRKAKKGSFGVRFKDCRKKPASAIEQALSALGRRLDDVTDIYAAEKADVQAKKKEAKAQWEAKKEMKADKKASKHVSEKRMGKKLEKSPGMENTKAEPTPLSKAVDAKLVQSRKSGLSVDKSTVYKAGHQSLVEARKNSGMIARVQKLSKKETTHQQRMLQISSAISSLQHVAFVSEASHGYLVVDPPPHKQELFLRSDAEGVTGRSIFALPKDTSQGGGIIAVASKAFLNTCYLEKTPKSALGACIGTPSLLKKHVTAKAGQGGHHRKLLLHPSKSAEFVVERVY